MVKRHMLSARRARVLTAVAAALVVVPLLVIRSSPSTPRSTLALWGVQVASAPAAAQLEAITAITRAVAKRPSILTVNVPFENCSAACFDYPFLAPELQALRKYGAIPMVNWSSMSTPLSPNEPGYSLQRVAEGGYDPYIRSLARAAQAWGHPFFLRFDWEMNGNWFPWAERANGNHAGDFARAWRHVHDIFAAAGATNATWVWCPSTEPDSSPASLGGLFPGRAQVNWTCMDGYNYGALYGPRGWTGFQRVFGATYAGLERLAPNTPMLIGDVASSEHGGTKAGWITDMFGQLASRFPQLRGFVWFNTPDGQADWPLQTSTASLAAFRAGVSNPRYVANVFAQLGAAPVSVPRLPALIAGSGRPRTERLKP